MTKKKYTFIDLFAGCGGLTEGFLQTGRYEALAHVEWEKPMIATLRNRLVQAWNYTREEAMRKVIQFDIQKTDELINGSWSAESIKQYGANNHIETMATGLRGIVGKRKVDLIIGGPPCQAYSIHGRATDKNSMKDDYRNYLFESFCKVVDAFQPDAFVFENVRGLLSAKPGGHHVTKRIYEAFLEIGYDIRTPEMLPTALYDASDFQVAQNRPRVIILGIKHGSVLSLDELYTGIDSQKSKSPKRTVKDEIGNMPPLYPLAEPIKHGRMTQSYTQNTDPNITQHDARNYGQRERQIFREWVEGNFNHISHQEMIDYYKKKTGHDTLYQKYKSLEWDKPSHTVVAHLSKDGYMFIHPDAAQERSITIREAAMLMSFPIDYQFLGSTPYNYKMIGNAVPVRFAQGIARGIVKTLDKHKNL
ncbi:MAG: DNA cytosine methyltransferase [Prevotellaceae bacterium]|nr:DNA cytosine methyltransferase [Candidatus Colicola caccequi]MBQ0090357.1 DNA cytosine methyltransferase [Candidatus Faecinaster equi]